MQQLHKNNTPCHAELITEPSRSAASHRTSIMSLQACREVTKAQFND